MPTLQVRVSGFSGALAGINGNQPQQISRAQWLLSSVSVGTPMLRASTPLPMHAAAFALYRAMAANVAVDFSGAYIARPGTYVALDPTEKANISFWTGMTVANLLADRLLSIPTLMHAASLKASGGLTVANPASKVLADLVGQDTGGGWHCLEAKARQSKFSAANRSHWKTQAQSITSVGGVGLSSRSYVAVRVGKTYSAELVDPPVHGTDVAIELDGQHGFLATYYRGINEFVEAGQDREFFNQVYRLKIAGFDVHTGLYYFLGIDRRIFDAPEQRSGLQIDAFEEGTFTLASNGMCLVASQQSTLGT
jgi:hypothetical protein